MEDNCEKHPHFSPHPNRTTQPLGKFFHPTRAVFVPSTDGERLERTDSSHWSSRASRKNRYPQSSIPLSHHVQGSDEKRPAGGLGPSSSHVTINQRIKHPHSQLKPQLKWDISFWVAIMFVLGSAAWICNGHLLYTPLSPTPSPDHADAAAWLAFAGGTLFAIGAYLAYVEALNAGHEQMFVELRRATAAKEVAAGINKSNDHLVEDVENDGRKPYKFRWIGLSSPRDIGYLASAIQLFAASIFWVSTVTGLPNALPTLTTAWPPHATTIIFFWTPQVIGGTGFIIASILLTVEEQKKWWKIAPQRIGWHVGFWNLVGALGFTLCGALGYASTASTKVNYQSVLSTFWGSWAFMIGSVAQLWEVVWRVPDDSQEQKDST
ncbi:hypothetical protein BDW22DRAFT_1362961 [Trametopsis cervina]|nr:hypothetical protein BDW22DRAFT_1362961 [Trametopsis cervina]